MVRGVSGGPQLMPGDVSFSDSYAVFATRGVHAEKYFPNFIKSTWNQIVFTIFRLIWIQINLKIQTEVRLDLNQSENGKYNMISV